MGQLDIIVDHHAVFNCCLDAWMEVSIEGDRITVVEVVVTEVAIVLDVSGGAVVVVETGTSVQAAITRTRARTSRRVAPP